jgi:hypothetical protein
VSGGLLAVVGAASGVRVMGHSSEVPPLMFVRVGDIARTQAAHAQAEPLAGIAAAGLSAEPQRPRSAGRSEAAKGEGDR